MRHRRSASNSRPTRAGVGVGALRMMSCGVLDSVTLVITSSSRSQTGDARRRVASVRHPDVAAVNAPDRILVGASGVARAEFR